MYLFYLFPRSSPSQGRPDGGPPDPRRLQRELLGGGGRTEAKDHDRVETMVNTMVFFKKIIKLFQLT